MLQLSARILSPEFVHVNDDIVCISYIRGVSNLYAPRKKQRNKSEFTASGRIPRAWMNIGIGYNCCAAPHMCAQKTLLGCLVKRCRCVLKRYLHINVSRLEKG